MINSEKINNQLFENVTIDKMHDKAQKSLREDVVDPVEFIELYQKYNNKKYSPNSIKNDQKYVKTMEEKFAREDVPEQAKYNKLATILEVILHNQAELNNWLGSDAATIKTSRFDDIANGVDTIVEFNKDKQSASHLGLALDATIHSKIYKKIQRIKDEITIGKLAKIKYFKSDKTHYMGSLSQIPRVIIGADSKTVQELGELWLNRKNKELAEHSIQFQILDQILIQLESFEEYAEKCDKPEIAEIYRKSHKIIMEIYEQKEATVNDTGERDSMFEEIKRAMDDF